MTTMTEIRESNKAAGFHWFDPVALRFFNCTLGRKAWDTEEGALFISSERYSYDMEPRYTIRSWNRTTGEVDTVGRFQGYKTSAAARAAINKMIGE